MKTRQSIKREYTESEAATELRLSVEELRTLVRTHILQSAEVPEIHPSTFLASEVIVLKMLARPAG